MTTVETIKKTFTYLKLYTMLDWIKKNPLLAGLGGVVVTALFFPRLLGGLFGSARRRHRRHVHKAITGTYRRRRRVLRMAAPIRRHRTSRRRSGKPAWMIRGSKAAKLRMAKLRRLRRKR